MHSSPAYLRVEQLLTELITQMGEQGGNKVEVSLEDLAYSDAFEKLRSNPPVEADKLQAALMQGAFQNIAFLISVVDKWNAGVQAEAKAKAEATAQVRSPVYMRVKQLLTELVTQMGEQGGNKVEVSLEDLAYSDAFEKLRSNPPVEADKLQAALMQGEFQNIALLISVVDKWNAGVQAEAKAKAEATARVRSPVYMRVKQLLTELVTQMGEQGGNKVEVSLEDLSFSDAFENLRSNPPVEADKLQEASMHLRDIAMLISVVEEWNAGVPAEARAETKPKSKVKSKAKTESNAITKTKTKTKATTKAKAKA